MAYIRSMKQIVGTSLLALMLAFPVTAQDDNGQIDEGFSLLEEGMGLLLQGLMKEIGPASLELEGKIVDLNAYHFPEMLPNGDIIIRRKLPLDLPEDGETDL